MIFPQNDIFQLFRWHYIYSFIISSPELKKRQEKFEALLEHQENFEAY